MTSQIQYSLVWGSRARAGRLSFHKAHGICRVGLAEEKHLAEEQEYTRISRCENYRAKPQRGLQVEFYRNSPYWVWWRHEEGSGREWWKGPDEEGQQCQLVEQRIKGSYFLG